MYGRTHSLVQRVPAMRGRRTQAPVMQIWVVLEEQRSSPHEVPSGADSNTQPSFGSHAPAWHGSLGAGQLWALWLQPLGSLQASTVQLLPSSQLIGDPRQRPPRQLP